MLFIPICQCTVPHPNHILSYSETSPKERGKVVTEREWAGWEIRELVNWEISKFVNLLIILTFAQNMQQKR